MTPDKTTVLYILGTGRSGTTLLGNVLGQIDGWFAAGEIRYFWERGVQHAERCGCGQPVPECEVWSQVIAELGVTAAEARHINADIRSRLRIRDLPKNLRDIERMMPSESSRRAMTHTYAAIRDISGADVVVDASKLPVYAMVLDQLDSIDLKVLHVLRDPRATAYSWQREQASGATGDGDERMDQFGPVKATTLWHVWNRLARSRWADSDRYLRVHYEDFVRDPAAVVARVGAFMGRQVDTSFIEGNTIDMVGNHNCAGNPNRRRCGPSTVRYDGEWESKLVKRDRSVVTALASPLLQSMGYKTRVKSS